MPDRAWCEHFSGRVLDMFPAAPSAAFRSRPPHFTAWARMHIAASLRNCYDAESRILDGQWERARTSLADAETWLGHARDYLQQAGDRFGAKTCEELRDRVRANGGQVTAEAAPATIERGSFEEPASSAISDYLDRHVLGTR